MAELTNKELTRAIYDLQVAIKNLANQVYELETTFYAGQNSGLQYADEWAS